jgi:hypothetical protein
MFMMLTASVFAVAIAPDMLPVKSKENMTSPLGIHGGTITVFSICADCPGAKLNQTVSGAIDFEEACTADVTKHVKATERTKSKQILLMNPSLG